MKATPALVLAFVLLFGATDLQAQTPAAELGQIDFPTSAESEAAQKKFLEGALLLHSFEYEDAAEAFVEAQELEPGLAMAYWGEAMTNNRPVWHQSFPDRIRDILGRLAPTPEARLARAPTERERGFLAAVELLAGEGSHWERNHAYAAAMGRLAERFPEDQEVQAFHALALLGTSGPNRDTRIYMRAAAVAEEVYEVNPRHPGALHYLIHAYDDPVHAPLGLRAARRYARVAPAASHALHMPSHIFVALGLWDDVVASNEASAAAAEARRERKDLDLNGRGYHALWWLLYGYAQQGRYDDARGLLAELEDDYRNRPDGTTRIPYHLVVMRAAYLIETERTDDVAVEIDSEGMAPDMAAPLRFADGWTAYGEADAAGVRDAASALREALGAGNSDAPDRVAGSIMADELDAMALRLAGDVEVAHALLAEAAAAEAEMPFMFGPPRIIKPTHELLGEWLLEDGRYDEAGEAFETALARAPRRTRALLGLARAAAGAGDAPAARRAYADLQRILHRADPDLAFLAEVHQQAASDD